ncbi:MAG: TlpA disulfide reductase family protein [Actinomycetota bacterium]
MNTEPQQSETESAASAETASTTIDVNAREAENRRSGPSKGLLAAILFGLAAVVLMQVFLLTSMNNTDEQITALDNRLDTVGAEAAGVQDAIDGVDTKIDDLAAKIDSLATKGLIAPSASGASGVTAPSGPQGWLPPFEQGQPDSALGVVLGDVTGPEYYTEAAITIDPTDGVSRAWLIWAHWCPHCQRELPEVSEWYVEHRDEYPNVELLSVSSSIDDTRGNPLEPYLDDLQLPFPTIVDADLALAQQLGVSAYPFWVFTGPDGTTLLRIAGYLETAQIQEIFAQLEEMAAA